MPRIANSDISRDFISIAGVVNRPALVVEEITRPGIDGQAYRIIAKRGQPFAMRAVTDYDQKPDDLVEEIMGMVGTMCEVEDDSFRSIDKLMFLQCRPIGFSPVVNAAGGVFGADANYVVSFNFTFQATEIT